MLNAKQEAFCLHYAQTGNATESYKNAGYRTRNERSLITLGCRMLKNPEIKKRLAELTAEINAKREEENKRKIMDVEEMQERLSAFARMEVLEEIATVKGQVLKKRNGAAEAIKAITQLAKMQGVADNVNVNISIPVIAGDEALED